MPNRACIRYFFDMRRALCLALAVFFCLSATPAQAQLFTDDILDQFENTHLKTLSAKMKGANKKMTEMHNQALAQGCCGPDAKNKKSCQKLAKRQEKLNKKLVSTNSYISDINQYSNKLSSMPVYRIDSGAQLKEGDLGPIGKKQQEKIGKYQGKALDYQKKYTDKATEYQKKYTDKALDKAKPYAEKGQKFYDSKLEGIREKLPGKLGKDFDPLCPFKSLGSFVGDMIDQGDVVSGYQKTWSRLLFRCFSSFELPTDIVKKLMGKILGKLMSKFCFKLGDLTKFMPKLPTVPNLSTALRLPGLKLPALPMVPTNFDYCSMVPKLPSFNFRLPRFNFLRSLSLPNIKMPGCNLGFGFSKCGLNVSGKYGPDGFSMEDNTGDLMQEIVDANKESPFLKKEWVNDMVKNQQLYDPKIRDAIKKGNIKP